MLLADVAVVGRDPLEGRVFYFGAERGAEAPLFYILYGPEFQILLGRRRTDISERCSAGQPRATVPT
ncbi:MAG: hypothetical protein JWO91_3550 [Acidobacteriaceae bacterium]|nr:hypothetical protein [Acidobacteriaceae bacterium]